jgi:hypothetical protein
MMTSIEQIKDFTKRVVVQFQPMRVLLFGSYARGEQGEDSDVDLLIIMPFSGRRAAKVSGNSPESQAELSSRSYCADTQHRRGAFGDGRWFYTRSARARTSAV